MIKLAPHLLEARPVHKLLTLYVNSITAKIKVIVVQTHLLLLQTILDRLLLVVLERRALLISSWLLRGHISWPRCLRRWNEARLLMKGFFKDSGSELLGCELVLFRSKLFNPLVSSETRTVIPIPVARKEVINGILALTIFSQEHLGLPKDGSVLA